MNLKAESIRIAEYLYTTRTVFTRMKRDGVLCPSFPLTHSIPYSHLSSLVRTYDSGSR